MEALTLIQSAERIGCQLVAEGEYIRVMNINRLPADLKEKIKEHKKQILSILLRDQQAKEAGFTIGLSGKVYTLSLNKKSMVYIEKIGSNWEVWQETYQKGKSRAIRIKVIYSDSDFEYVLLKAKSHLNYMEQKSNV